MHILSQLPKIKELPTLPEVLVKVQEYVNSDKASVDELAAIIKQDPALSSIILKTANSAFYNIINRRLSSVKESITRIGFNEVLKITMGMSVIKQFAHTSNIIDYRAFWRHSLTAASLTLIIADATKNSYTAEDRQNLFLAGLLHDIGILIYDQFFHEIFVSIVEHALHKETTYLAAEEVVVPKEPHAFIGGALLEIWRLAIPVIGTVRYHHIPRRAPENLKKLVAVVHLTEYVLCKRNIGSFEGQFGEVSDDVLQVTGLSTDDFNPLYEKAKEEAEKADMFLKVGVDTHYDSKDNNTNFGDVSLLKKV